MPTTYMTHPQNGATHAYDHGEIERLQKLGWAVTKEPTGLEILAAKKAIIAQRLRAELAALETPEPAVEPVAVERKKPGPKRKVAA